VFQLAPVRSSLFLSFSHLSLSKISGTTSALSRQVSIRLHWDLFFLPTLKEKGWNARARCHGDAATATHRACVVRAVRRAEKRVSRYARAARTHAFVRETLASSSPKCSLQQEADTCDAVIAIKIFRGLMRRPSRGHYTVTRSTNRERSRGRDAMCAALKWTIVDDVAYSRRSKERERERKREREMPRCSGSRGLDFQLTMTTGPDQRAIFYETKEQETSDEGLYQASCLRKRAYKSNPVHDRGLVHVACHGDWVAIVNP